MTLGDIYGRVCFLMWGNSNVPVASQTALLGSSGIIANIHKKIQKKSNFWFMYRSAIVEATPFVQSYDLPSNYKQFIRALWDLDGEEGFSLPLVPIRNEDAIRKWTAPIGHEEYPASIEIAGSSLVLYPEPNPSFPYETTDAEYDATATRDLHVIYWGYEGTIPDDDAEYTIYTDNMTVHAYEVIINMVVSEIAFALDEYNKASVYQQKGSEALDELMVEHESRMRKQFYVAKQYPYGREI